MKSVLIIFSVILFSGCCVCKDTKSAKDTLLWNQLLNTTWTYHTGFSFCGNDQTPVKWIISFSKGKFTSAGDRCAIDSLGDTLYSSNWYIQDSIIFIYLEPSKKLNTNQPIVITYPIIGVYKEEIVLNVNGNSIVLKKV